MASKFFEENLILQLARKVSLPTIFLTSKDGLRTEKKKLASSFSKGKPREISSLLETTPYTFGWLFVCYYNVSQK